MNIGRDLGISQRANIVPVAGQPAYRRFESPLDIGHKTRTVLIDIAVPVTLAGAITRVKNNGSVFALFPSLGILENGKPTMEGDSRCIARLSQSRVRSAITQARLTTTAAGTYTLRGRVHLDFALPADLGLKPMETAYIDKVQENGVFSAFSTFDATGLGLVVLGGGGTIVVGAPTIRVMQAWDADPTGTVPVYRPGFQMLSFPIAAAVAGQEFNINVGSSIRSLVLLQDSDVGEVTDMITRFQLIGAAGNYVGEDGPVDWDLIALEQEFAFGGDVYATPAGSSIVLNTQLDGKLTNIFQAGQDVNLRLKLWGQPSVTAGATNGNLKVLVETLDRVAGAVAA